MKGRDEYIKEVIEKTRNWFLTINENAECFHTFHEKIKGFEKCEYSYILHNKDNEEQPHYHLCILFENARTFATMQKHFPGAHIEIMESKYKSFRYLLHLDDVEKHQYNLDEVVQRGDNVEYYSTHDEHIKLDTESLLDTITTGQVRSLYDAVKVFGCKQTNMYRNLINELINDHHLNKEYYSNDEVMHFLVKIDDLEELSNKQAERISDLSNINNKLLVRIRQLEEYEKIVKERGLL